MKKRFMSIMAAAAFFVAGCGKGGGGETAQPSQERGEQVLKFGCFDYVDSIDPGNMINAAWNCTRFGVGECLFRFNDAMDRYHFLFVLQLEYLYCLTNRNV